MKNIYKAAISLFLLAVLLLKIDKSSVINEFQNIEINFFIFAIISFLIAIFFQIFRLYFLFKDYCSFPLIAQVTFIGFFLNNFFPTNFGGDIYKIFKLKNNVLKKSTSISYVLFDRVVGLLVLILIFLTYLLFNNDDLKIFNLKKEIFIENYFIILIIIIIILIFLFNFFFSIVKKNLKIRYYFNKIKYTFIESLNQIIKISLTKYAMQFLLSIIFHTFKILVLYFLINSLNENLILQNLVFIYCLVALFSSLPISFGGLGIRESVLSICLVNSGFNLNLAVSIAFLNLTLLWSYSIFGGIFFLLKNFKKF